MGASILNQGYLDKKNEGINDTLRDHISSIKDWPQRELMELFHEWSNRFNQRFALAIPTPAIQLSQVRPRAYGTYRPGRNGFGLRYEITVNTKYLHRPLSEHLDTLLHEQLHLWQELHGKPGKPPYHNKQYREKAKSLGLIVDARGISLGVVPGPFLDILSEFGVSTSELHHFFADEENENAGPRRRGQSKLKKWTCGCTNVRAAVVLKAKCLVCGNEFKRSEPSW